MLETCEKGKLIPFTVRLPEDLIVEIKAISAKSTVPNDSDTVRNLLTSALKSREIPA
jgi:metal-responsive CopG/Arc/MetJ family transcriptional regulator